MFERGILVGIDAELKSGKEATVYLGRSPSGLAAVKVYRDRAVRSFKADDRYRAGRYVGDTRTEKAMARRTGYGRRAQAALWAAHEYHVLWRLHAAGIAVPEPLVGPEPFEIARAGEVVAMRYVGDHDGPAPRLADVRLDPDEAAAAFEGSVAALGAIWRAGYVHGDFSTYNLLWWHGEVVVIDLPQAVETRQREARALLERDARSLCGSFRTHGIDADPRDVLARVLAPG